MFTNAHLLRVSIGFMTAKNTHELIQALADDRGSQELAACTSFTVQGSFYGDDGKNVEDCELSLLRSDGIWQVIVTSCDKQIAAATPSQLEWTYSSTFIDFGIFTFFTCHSYSLAAIALALAFLAQKKQITPMKSDVTTQSLVVIRTDSSLSEMTLHAIAPKEQCDLKIDPFQVLVKPDADQIFVFGVFPLPRLVKPMAKEINSLHPSNLMARIEKSEELIGAIQLLEERMALEPQGDSPMELEMQILKVKEENSRIALEIAREEIKNTHADAIQRVADDLFRTTKPSLQVNFLGKPSLPGKDVARRILFGN